MYTGIVDIMGQVAVVTYPMFIPTQMVEEDEISMKSLV
jgi:hypothetical protein